MKVGRKIVNSITHADAVAVALLMLGASIGYAQVSPENSAVLAFQRAADHYAFLHRRLERRVEPVEMTANPETLAKAIEAMATSDRRRRPGVDRHAREPDRRPSTPRAAGLA